LSPDAERACDRIVVFNAAAEEWGKSWPATAETFARGVAERTLTQRAVPGPVRAAANCLLDLLK
jgi:hypothetical protein